MTKTVILKVRYVLVGNVIPQVRRWSWKDKVIKGLPADVYSIKAPEPAAASTESTPANTADSKADKPTEKAKA